MITSILHISDLHRDPANPLTNGALLDSLARDRERYGAEDPHVRAPALIIVSGDLVAGVSPSAPNASDGLRRQYEEAETFLVTLADTFLDGDRDRIILIPGNHDVSYPHVHASLTEINLRSRGAMDDAIVQQYINDLNSPGSSLRWSWRSLSFFEISDRETYRQRLAPFADFYKHFYRGLRAFPLDPESQYDIFHYPTFGLVVAAFNSCYNNDPLNRVAMIHPDCIAGASRALRNHPYTSSVRLAVWHHSVNGGPLQFDYMDPGTLQVLIDCGFSLGFHGHQHKPQFIDERFEFGLDRKITVVSAGTLCGGRSALPAGHPRAYNMVQIDAEGLTGTLHLRQMLNSDFASPIWGPGVFPGPRQTHIPFRLQPPPDAGVDRTAFILSAAESHLANGRPEEAIKLSRPFAPSHDLARRILLEALLAAGDVEGLGGFFYPPRSPVEAIYLADALWASGRKERIRELLDHPIVRQATDPSLIEMRQKYTERLKL